MADQPNAPDSQKRSMRIDGNVANPYEKRVLKPGDKIGPNRVERLVGEGGNANVYKVWHEGLEVARAVKMLKMSSNKEARERFLTEAKILADIKHPNIVEIYNIGYFDRQIPFIEMEYLDGISVKRLVAQNARIALPAALSIAYFVCQALQYAHTKDYTLYGNVYRGLIHRDIKPDNIFITQSGQVKLTDFGIARPSEVSLHTVGAKIMGTLVYLSPEQLNGTDLDHRSDVFSLGCVLYEMIAGARAFPQKTLSDLVQKKTKGEFRSLDSYKLNVPKSLNQVITKTMALQPADRFGTAADFGHELFRILTEVTERAPQDIVIRYVQDPTSVVESGTRRVTLPLGWIVGGLSGLVVILATLLALLALS